MDTIEKRTLIRVVVALVLFIIIEIIVRAGLLEGEQGLWIQFVLFLIPYLIAGYDVLARPNSRS